MGDPLRNSLVLFVAGWVILFAVDDHIRRDGWAMCFGSNGAILLLTCCSATAPRRDTERQAEETAREYFDKRGHWPARTRRGCRDSAHVQSALVSSAEARGGASVPRRRQIGAPRHAQIESVISPLPSASDVRELSFSDA